MADNVLGIAGLVDIDDIQKTFDALISQLDRVGVTTDNLSERMTKALSDIAKSTDKDLATKAREAMAVLKDTIQEANESLGDTPAMIDNAKNEVTRLEAACNKLEKEIGKTVVGSKEFNAINKQLASNRESLQLAKDDVVDLEKSYATVQTTIGKMQGMYDGFVAVIQEYTKATSESSAATGTHTQATEEETAAINEQNKSRERSTESTNQETGARQQNTEAVNEGTEAIHEQSEAKEELSNTTAGTIENFIKEAKSVKELQAEYKQYELRIKEIEELQKKLTAHSSIGYKRQRLSDLQQNLDEYEKSGKWGRSNSVYDTRESVKKLQEEIALYERLQKDLELYRKEAEMVKDAIDGWGKATKEKSPVAELRSLRSEITQLLGEYNNLTLAEKNSAKGEELKNKIETLTEKAAELKREINLTNKTIEYESSNTSGFQGLTQAINLLVSGLATAQGAAAAFGVSEEDLVKVQTTLQASLAATNFLTEAGTALQSKSAMMHGVAAIQAWAAAKAVDMETAAKGRNIVVTTAATVAQKIFNAVAKANPYVLLATAILTVGGALAAFILGTKEATEAEKEQQEAMEKARQAAESYKNTLSNTYANLMSKYAALRREYKELQNDHQKSEWIKNNKKRFEELGISVTNVKSAEDVFRNNTQNVVDSFKRRAEAAAIAAQMVELYKQKMDLEQEATEVYDRKKVHVGDRVYESISDRGMTYDGGSSGTYNGGRYTLNHGTYAFTQKGADEYNRKLFENDPILSKQNEQYKKLNEKIDEADARLQQLGDVANSTVPTTTPTSSTAPVLKSAQELSDELLRIRKETVDRQLAIEKEGSDRWIELEKRRIELQAEIDRRAATSSGNEALKNLDDSYRGGKSGLTEGQYHERRAAIEGQVSQQIQAINAKAADDLRAIDDGRAQRLNELLEPYKTLAQQRLEIEKKYDDDLEKIRQARRETEAALANAQTDDEKKELQKRLDNIISAEAQATTNKGKELAGFDLDVLKQNPAYIRAFEDLNNTSSETLTQLIALFEKAKAGAAQSLNPEDLKEYTEALQSMYDVLADRKPFDAVSDTKKQLYETTSLLNTAKIRLEQVKNGGKVVKSLRMEDNKLVATYWTEAEAQEEVNRLLDEQTKKRNQYNKALKNALSKVDELAQAIASVGDAMGGTAGEALGLISNVMTFVTSTIDGITACAQTGAQALSAIEKASVILTIISAAIQLFQKISSLYKDAHAQYEEFAAKQKEINQLRDAVNDYKLAVIEATNAEKRWFDSTGLASLRDMYEYSNQALDAYVKKVAEAQAIYQNESGGGWLTNALSWILELPGKIVGGILDFVGIDNGWIKDYLQFSAGGSIVGWALREILNPDNYEEGTTAAINNLRIETREKSSGFLGTGIGGHSQRTEDLTKWVKENLGADLFDENYMINTELANTVLDKYGDKLVGETKETLEELIHLKEEYDKFREQLEDYVSQMFSPLTSDMVDALWDWLKDGKDVMDSFKKYASDTFAEIAREMVKQALLTKIFDGFQDKLADLYEVYAAGGMDEKQLSDYVMQATDALLDNAEKGLPAIQNLLTYIDEKFKERGFDITGSDSEVYQQQGSSGAWQSLGEDTGRELNGRFTALQITGESILVQAIEQTNILVAIQQDITTTRIAVVDINANVGRLIEAQNTANGHLEAISKNTYQLYEMRDDIKEIVKKVKNV